MTAPVRNRLLALGVFWGLLLAAVPALLMTNPYQLTGLLIAGLACAALSGWVGTLAAGRRAAKDAGRSGLLARAKIESLQGLVGGGVAALLIWTLMAVTISSFTLRNPVELSVLISPRVFTGSLFVALSASVYTLLDGILLSPLFGTLVNRAIRAGRGAAGGKEDLVVR